MNREELRKQFKNEKGLNPIGEAHEWSYNSQVCSLYYVEWLEEKLMNRNLVENHFNKKNPPTSRRELEYIDTIRIDGVLTKRYKDHFSGKVEWIYVPVKNEPNK